MGINWVAKRLKLPSFLNSNHQFTQLDDMAIAVDSRTSFLFIKVWVFAWTAFFLLLGVLGITSSSLSLISASEVGSTSTSSPVYGEPRSIRSDEYYRSTPWDLGLLKSGNADFVTPLAHHNTSFIYPDPDSWIDYINSIDTIWPRLVPGISVSQEFAFAWWTPIWIALIFLPLLLVRMGVSFVVSVCVTTLIIASPVNAWWSLWISPIVGFSAMAAYLFLLTLSDKKRNFPLKSLYVVGSAFGLFKLLTCYQPWVIVIAPMILVATCAFAIEKRGWKRVSKSLIPIVALFVFISALYLSKNWDALTTLTSTLYPGERRSSGAFVSSALTWGAPHLQILNLSPEMIGTNPSEISSSFSILLIASLAALVNRPHGLQFNRFQIFSGMIVALWLVWITANLPNLFSTIPVISLVRPDRAAAVFGIICALFFALSTISKDVDNVTTSFSKSQTIAITAGILAGSLTILGGLALQEGIPRLGMIRISLAAIFVASFTYLISLPRMRPYGLIGLSVFSVLMVFQVNPIQRSVDGLALGQVPTNLVSMNEGGSYWASDSGAVDAIFMANNLKSLSGQQLMGPEISAWLQLDPGRNSEPAWNRGASYVSFAWGTNLVPSITSPNGDVIQIEIDPCELRRKYPTLEHVISSSNLRNECLVKVYEFEQIGKLMSVYQFSDGAQ